MKRSKIGLRAAILNTIRREHSDSQYHVSIYGCYATGGISPNAEAASIEAADALAERIARQIEGLEAAGFRVLLPGEVA